MNTISETYINALLADAAYVNLHVNTNNSSPLLTGPALTTAIAARLTQPQANFITTNFQVVNQELSPTGGFDAVVWRGKAGTDFAGKVYVSMRGTQGATDIADDISLAATGVPKDQIVSMVNWWLRITAPAGPNTARQIGYEPIYDSSSPPIQIGTRFVAAPNVAGTGTLVGQGSIEAVSGHSLGGYLSTAFTRLFGGALGYNVQSVNTFNSAGFNNLQAGNIDSSFNQIAQLIGSNLGLGSFTAVAPKQTNTFGENGINVTTNSWADFNFTMPGFNQYGTRQGLYQEDGLSGNPINNHSMYKQTDLLALGALMEKLDPSFTIDKLSSFTKAGSNFMAASYEGVLDGLRKLLISTHVTTTPPLDDAGGSEGPQPQAREDFHANLKDLAGFITEPNGALKALVGKLILSLPNGSLATTAKTDFAAFLSLNALSPVVISTTDAATISALKAANADLSTAWTADKNARLYGDTTKVFDYSDTWYTDRAAMLAALLQRNQTDAQGILPGNQNIRYFDAQTNTQILIGAGATNEQRVQYLFGGDAADPLEGKGFADHLYGGAGADTIDGRGGNDYLEGGTGTDTYQFSASNWGNDTVVDADGLGQIKIGETILGIASKWGNSPNVWLDVTQTYLIAKVKVSDTRTDLRITRKDNASQASITIQNWTAEKSLGIVLGDTATPAPSANSVSDISVWHTYNPVTAGTGSTVVHNAGQVTNTPGGNYQIEYTVQAATNSFDSNSSSSQFIVGNAHAQQINTGSGNDLIMADRNISATVEGNDVVVSGGGSDIIFTGSGSDFIDAGDGDDFIAVGGVGILDVSSTGTLPNGASLHPGLGPWGTYNDSDNNDLGGRLWVYGMTVRQSYLGWSGDAGTASTEVGDADVVYAGAGNDRVYGGLGDDLLMLESGNDFAVGYMGDDDILGGSGADFLVGDGLYVSDTHWSSSGFPGIDNLRRVDSGDDLLSGGEGNDVLLGQAGDDILEGDGGNDDLYGDDADYLNGTYNASLGATGAFSGKDSLDGGSGNDRLVGGGNNDELFGGADDDILWGDNTVLDALAAADHGEDYLDGEGGNDTLYGGGKNDILMGGSDNDLLYGEAGNDTLEGGTGSDFLSGGEGNDTYVFSLGDGLAFANGDVIADTQGSNTLRIDGVALTDIGLTRSSTGQLMLGYGNFVKAAVNGTTTVTADNWVMVQDSLTRQVIKFLQVNGQTINFADFVGKNLNSVVSASTSNSGEQLTTGAAVDTVTVQHNDTVVSAGAGNDAITLEGGRNTVQVRRGDGKDTIEGSVPLTLGGTNTVEFGAGIARGDISVQRGAGGAVVLTAAGSDAGVVMSGGIGNVSFEDTGEVFTLADLVQAELSARQTAGDDVIEGSVFNDTLDGGAGNDILLGYEGDDTLVAGSGEDILIGGWGNDTYVIGANAGQVTLLTGLREEDAAAVAGSDRILLAGSKTQTVWTASRVDYSLVLTTQLAGAATSSSIRLEGYFDSGVSAEAWAVATVEFEDGSNISLQELLAQTGQMTEADDVIYGRQGGELIYALGGNDTVFALGGNDVVAGGAGNDMLDGGDGNDALDGNEGDDVLAGGAGHDLLHGNDGNDVINGGMDDDVLWGDAGDDQLAGDAGADTLVGGEGADLLDGGSGADILEGEAGDDTLLGGSGDDHLLGGDGADLLKGGAGSDMLEGAEGADVYVFDVNSLDASRVGEVDVIVDTQGADIIRLDGTAPDTIKVYANENGNFTLLWGTGGVQVIGGEDALSRMQLEIGGVRSALAGYLVAAPSEESPVTLAQANANFITRHEYETRAQIDYAGSIGVLAWRYKASDALGALMQPVSSDEAWADISQSSYSETQTPHYYLFNGYKNAQGKYFDSSTYNEQVVEDRFTLTHIEPAYQSVLGDGTVVNVPAEYFFVHRLVEAARTYQIPGLTAVSEQRVSYETDFTFLPAATSIDAQLGASANTFTFSAGLVNAGEGDDYIKANLASLSRQNYVGGGYDSGAAQPAALTRRNEILLTGQTAATWINGGAGNDTIVGSEVSDVIYGGSGFNSLDGGVGPDRYLVLDEGAENPGFSYIAEVWATQPLQNPLYETYGGIPQELLPPGADIDTVEFGPGIRLDEIQFRIKTKQNDTDYFAPNVGAYTNSPYLVVERGGRRLAAIELTSNDITMVGLQPVPADAGIEFLEFQDGQKISLATALGMATNDILPVLVSPLADTAALTNQGFSYTIGLNAFEDPMGRPITLTASLADGSPLPSWLHLTFDAPQGWVLAGTPAFGQAGEFTVRVTGATSDGNQASDDLVLTVSSNNTAPVVGEVLSNGQAFENEPFVWQLPQSAFIDNDVHDSLMWTFTPDNPEAAAWLIFDATTQTFSGTPTWEYLYWNVWGTLSVTDLSGVTASQQIFIEVGELPGISLIGTEGDDVLTGTRGTDELDGGAGSDVLIGGLGRDTYYVDVSTDQVIEGVNEGYDTVYSDATFTLSDNVEDLILQGGAGDIDGTGNLLDNYIEGNEGANKLSGAAGDDYLWGGAGADRLRGGTGADYMGGGEGDDLYEVDNAADTVEEWAGEGTDTVETSVAYGLGNEVENLILTGTADIDGAGNELNNYMLGNAGANVITSGLGNDLVYAGEGNDTIFDDGGSNLLDGGSGADNITGSIGSDMFIGGAGDDIITTDGGSDIIAFNRGDGMDTVTVSTGADNTLSLGGGIEYADLLFSKNGDDLIMINGTNENITFSNWYTSNDKRSVANLQMVIEGTGDYDPASSSLINNKFVNQFDFNGLVSQFDLARAATPGLTSWALSSSLLAFHLGGSDEVAMGGDLAYQYAKNGNVSTLSLASAQAVLENPQFGVVHQTLFTVSP